MRWATVLAVWFALASGDWRLQRDASVGEPGRIAGRVLTESGNGIPGATVVANVIADPYRPARQYRVSTGPDGGYVFEHVVNARFRLLAVKPGYSHHVVLADRIKAGSVVDVTASDVASGIDLVMCRTGSVTGRVTRPDGTPVVGANVGAEIRGASGRLLGLSPSVFTDSSGRYLLAEVPPGTYRLSAIYSVLTEMIGQVIPPRYTDWARTFHPDSTEFDRGTPVTIEPGARIENIDVVLQPETRQRLSGVVAAENGTRLRNVRVEYASTTGLSGLATASAGGRFAAEGVGGTVTLLASAETDDGVLVGLLKLDPASSLDDVRIALGPPGSIAGRLVFADGRPPREYPLYVQLVTDWHRPDRGDAFADTARVGADDRFRIGNLVGDRRVTVIGLLPEWEVREMRRGGRVLADNRIAFATGDLVDDVEIVIARQ